MPPEQTVTIDEVRRVAELANLLLTPEEEPRMQRDLNAILGHIDRLNQLDTRDVPPMTQVADILSLHLEDGGRDLRPDTLQPSIDRRAIMRNAPETDGRFFKVPKVIDRA